MDYEALRKKAIAYARSKKFEQEEAEDFAQEVIIKAFEINGPVNFEYCFLNYREFHNADKRMLSCAQSQFSAARAISLDAPINSSESDSTQFSDIIGVSGADMEGRSEMRFIEQTVQAILAKVKNERARKWAKKCFEEFLDELI